MATYFLLMKLTPEGRQKVLDDPSSMLQAQQGVHVPEVQVMGLYGVLGDYDFVSVIDAPDNASAARFSLELGVRGGVHVTTLPAIPISKFEDLHEKGMENMLAGAMANPPGTSMADQIKEVEEMPREGRQHRQSQ